MDNTGDQTNNRTPNDRPWLYKKGQSGNPSGRPKGISLKEYAKQKFNTMTDEEREEFFNGLPKNEIWKMAEGNPATKLQGDEDAPLTLIVKNVNGNNNTPQLHPQAIPGDIPPSSPTI